MCIIYICFSKWHQLTKKSEDNNVHANEACSTHYDYAYCHTTLNTVSNGAEKSEDNPGGNDRPPQCGEQHYEYVDTSNVELRVNDKAGCGYIDMSQGRGKHMPT